MKTGLKVELDVDELLRISDLIGCDAPEARAQLLGLVAEQLRRCERLKALRAVRRELYYRTQAATTESQKAELRRMYAEVKAALAEAEKS